MTNHPETIPLRIERRTAWITLDRHALNILDIRMMEALERPLPKSDFAKQLEEIERVYLLG